MLRHFARTLVIAVPPIAAVVLFLLGSAGLRELADFNARYVRWKRRERR